MKLYTLYHENEDLIYYFEPKNRKAPLIEYSKAIKDYSPENYYAEATIDSFFTEDETQLIIDYLKKEKDIDVKKVECKIPIENNVAPASAINNLINGFVVDGLEVSVFQYIKSNEEKESELDKIPDLYELSFENDEMCFDVEATDRKTKKLPYEKCIRNYDENDLFKKYPENALDSYFTEYEADKVINYLEKIVIINELLKKGDIKKKKIKLPIDNNLIPNYSKTILEDEVLIPYELPNEDFNICIFGSPKDDDFEDYEEFKKSEVDFFDALNEQHNFEIPHNIKDFCFYLDFYSNEISCEVVEGDNKYLITKDKNNVSVKVFEKEIKEIVRWRSTELT